MRTCLGTANQARHSDAFVFATSKSPVRLGVKSKEHMKSIELLAVGIRVVGLVTLIYAIQTGFQQFQAFVQFQSNIQESLPLFVYASLAQAAVLIAAALLMLKFPVSVSKFLLPKSEDGGPILDGSARDIEISLLTVIGVYILTWAVPDLFYNGIWWWYSEHGETSNLWDQRGPNEYAINQIVTVIEIAIGLYLCLRANGLSNLIRKLREAGSK